MVQRYLESIPLVSQTEAKVLGSGSGWEILDELRESGIDGMTVDEIAEKMDVPKSTVYAILRQLSAAGFVKTKRYKKRIGAPNKDRRDDELRTGKKKQIFMEAIPWGSIAYNEDFNLFIEKSANDIIDDSDIAAECAALVGKIMKKMKTDPDGKELLPENKVCPSCDLDHEAREMIWALLMAICDRVLNSQEIEDECKSHGLTV
jgi:DNA-binding MarR family transcriptional regulator